MLRYFAANAKTVKIQLQIFRILIKVNKRKSISFGKNAKYSVVKNKVKTRNCIRLFVNTVQNASLTEIRTYPETKKSA